MTKPVRVGIVGAGYVANHHLRALKDLSFIQIVGICDLDQTRARTLAENYRVSAVFPDLESMAAAQPDVIHILTPPVSHCSLALQALDMGCHVLVEKPMAESVDECDQMMAKAQEKGLVLSVEHSDRFDPVVLEAIEHAHSGKCGDIVAVHVIRSSEYAPYAGGPIPAIYRQGSYPFRDVGVHGLYLLESFLGPIQDLEVDYYESGRDPLFTFDEWRAHARCERGTGYMFLSWNSRPLQSELWIHGTHGVIHVDRFLHVCEVNRLLPGPKQIGFIIHGITNAAKRMWRVPVNILRFATGSLKPSPGIYRSVQEFHKALSQGRPAPVPAAEGRRIIGWASIYAERADRVKQGRVEAESAHPLPPARILVTGGTGFLGSALVERLRQTSEPIRLLLRRPPRPGSPADQEVPGGPISFVYGSLGDPQVVDRAVSGVKVVYHVGAAMKGGIEEFEQGTIWGTRNIIDACLRHSVQRLVYVSSLSVLDHAGHRTGDPVTEQSPYEPAPKARGAYTQTKLQAEHMVLNAVRERGLPAVVLRPGQILGPGAERVPPNGVFQIAGEWIVAGAGDRPLPLVYRDDVVDGLLLAASRDEAVGEVFNLVDQAIVRQNDYLRWCQPWLGQIHIRRMPVWTLIVAAIMIETLGAVFRRNVPLSRYRVRSLKPLWPFDTSRAAEGLGWKPSVGTAEGLKRLKAAAETNWPKLPADAGTPSMSQPEQGCSRPRP